MVAVEVVGDDAQKEAIEDRGQVVVVGHLVRGAEHRQQRHVLHLGAVGELALVQDGEERVQDRRVRLEDLVEEDDLRLGQHGLGLARVGAFAEGADVDGAEELVGLGEARQQVLEVARVDELGEGAHQRRLGGAGRADEEHVLAGDDGDEEQADDFLLVEEVLLHDARRLLETRGEARVRWAGAKAEVGGSLASWLVYRDLFPGRSGDHEAFSMLCCVSASPEVPQPTFTTRAAGGRRRGP